MKFGYFLCDLGAVLQSHDMQRTAGLTSLLPEHSISNEKAVTWGVDIFLEGFRER